MKQTSIWNETRVFTTWTASWNGNNRTYRPVLLLRSLKSTLTGFSSSSSTVIQANVCRLDRASCLHLSLVPRVISCGIPWKMATECVSVASLPQLRRLYLTWWLFPPIAPNDVSAVARSILESFKRLFPGVQLSMFFDENVHDCTFLSWERRPLSCSSIVLSFPGTQQSVL